MLRLRSILVLFSLFAFTLAGCSPALPDGGAAPGTSAPETPALETLATALPAFDPAVTVINTPTALAAATAVLEAPSTPAGTDTTAEAPATAVGSSAGTAGPEAAEHIRQVENGLVPLLEVMEAASEPFDLASRMAYYQTPGVSIAVIEGDQVEWARGYGVTAAGSQEPVGPDTLFQAASMSKPVTAMGVLLLAQSGRLDLDADVNTLLASWQVPENEYTRTEKVTARRLLSHTAGLTVHGFPGYTPGSDLPTPVQVLEGSAPANSLAVSVAATPGSRFQYSGGGYVLLQQLLMDVTREDFASYMQAQLLEPLEMEHSTFSQPLTEALVAGAASGHRFDGTPLPGGWNVYPELAPAGLWSTPSDLARFLLEIQRAAGPQGGKILSAEMAQAMLTPVLENNGLGLVVPGGGALFGHGGSNAGFRGLMFATRDTGQGAVVMVNSDTGMQLVFEIFRAIARVYGWPEVPDWRPAERHRAGYIALDPAALGPLQGEYVVQGLTLKVESAEGRLWIRIPADGPAYALYPDSETEFFTADGNQFIFRPGPDGKASTLQMNGWGDMELEAQRAD